MTIFYDIIYMTDEFSQLILQADQDSEYPAQSTADMTVFVSSVLYISWNFMEIVILLACFVHVFWVYWDKNLRISILPGLFLFKDVYTIYC